MIRYTLKCSQNHQFDSWFQSASAFEKLRAANLVECSVCGDCDVTKAVMAPRVRPSRSAAAPVAETETPAQPLSAPASPAEQAMAELKSKIEQNADYVGDNFATEARAIHDGDAPERSIYGEAKLEDAKSLIEDGIAVAPLPFRPGRKNN
jgi:hypothetical protein